MPPEWLEGFGWFRAGYFALFNVTWVTVGIAGIVLGFRMKEWSQSARATAIIVGALLALPGVLVALNALYLFGLRRS